MYSSAVPESALRPYFDRRAFPFSSFPLRHHNTIQRSRPDDLKDFGPTLHLTFGHAGMCRVSISDVFAALLLT